MRFSTPVAFVWASLLLLLPAAVTGQTNYLVDIVGEAGQTCAGNTGVSNTFDQVSSANSPLTVGTFTDSGDANNEKLSSLRLFFMPRTIHR